MSSNGGCGEAILTLFLLAAVVYAFFAALVIAFYVMLIFAAFLAFVTLAWTLVCLLAWNAPFRLGRIYAASDDARAFVLRGLFGSVVAPFGLLLAEHFLHVTVHWRYAAYYSAGGYVLLSLGLECLFARRANIPYVFHDDIVLPALPASQNVLPLPKPMPPHFASWDDEDGR